MELIDLAELLLIVGCVCVPIFGGVVMAQHEASKNPADDESHP